MRWTKAHVFVQRQKAADLFCIIEWQMLQHNFSSKCFSLLKFSLKKMRSVNSIYQYCNFFEAGVFVIGQPWTGQGRVVRHHVPLHFVKVFLLPTNPLSPTIQWMSGRGKLEMIRPSKFQTGWFQQMFHRPIKRTYMDTSIQALKSILGILS